jgi:hypothetical protein
MLNRRDSNLVYHGFYVNIEAEESVSREKLAEKLSDSVAWMEGTGKVVIQDPGLECFCEHGKRFQKKKVY